MASSPASFVAGALLGAAGFFIMSRQGKSDPDEATLEARVAALEEWAKQVEQFEGHPGFPQLEWCHQRKNRDYWRRRAGGQVWSSSLWSLLGPDP